MRIKKLISLFLIVTLVALSLFILGSVNCFAEAPAFNSSSQIKVFNVSSRELSNNAVSLYEYGNVVDYSQNVFEQATVFPGDNNVTVVLAKKTNGNFIAVTVSQYDYAIKEIDASGEDVTEIASDSELLDEEITIVSRTVGKKIAIWINGDEYLAETDKSVAKPVLGSFIDEGSYTFSANAYTAKYNYNKKGDVNGDLTVNIIDLVVLKKICANYQGAKPINSNVISFCKSTTVASRDLITFCNYLIGKTNSLSNNNTVDVIEFF